MAKKKEKPPEAGSEEVQAEVEVKLEAPNLPGVKPEQIENVEVAMNSWIKAKAEVDAAQERLEHSEGQLELAMRENSVVVYRLQGHTARLMSEEKLKVKPEKSASEDGLVLKRTTVQVSVGSPA